MERAGPDERNGATTASVPSPPRKRYRRVDLEEKHSEDDEWNVDDEEVDVKEPSYVPVAERKRRQLVKLGRLRGQGRPDDNDVARKESPTEDARDESPEDGRDPSDEINRRKRQLEEEELEAILSKSKETSLLLQHSQLKKLAEAKEESQLDKQLKEEEKILQSVKEHTALKGAAELAKDIQYEEPIKTAWKAPRAVLEMPQARHERVRRRKNILCEGEEVPPPLKAFRQMKFPRPIMRALEEKGKARLDTSKHDLMPSA